MIARGRARVKEAGQLRFIVMSGLLRLLLITAALGLVVMLLFRPTQIGRLGSRVRTVGYAYVAAILISAVLRLLFPSIFGWGN